MSYQPDWDVDKLRGEEAEALWNKTRQMVMAGTAEVKRDDQAAKTGNFYIEFKCRRGGEWKPSGLATTKAHLWVLTSWPIQVALPIWILKQIARRAFENGQTAEQRNGTHPTEGVLVRVADLLPHAIEFANAPVNESEAA